MIDAHAVLDTLLADLSARGIRLHVHDGRLQCEAPRGALTDELRQQLTAHKPALLARLGAPPRGTSSAPSLAPAGAVLSDASRTSSPRGTASAAGSALRDPLRSAIPRLACGEPAPLSLSQQRLWLLAQADAASAAYHMRIALRVTGVLDVAALEGAIQAVVRRHAVLRTAIVARGDAAVQVVHEAIEVPLVRRDLRALAPAAQRAALDEIMTQAARAPFALDCPPLLRAAIIQVGALEHVLILVLHHLVSDGGSLGILVAEIGERYTAAVQRRAARLPALMVQYADFAAWQRAQLTPARIAELGAYWLDELRDAPPHLELPTDHPGAPQGVATGAVEDFVIPAGLADELRAFSRAHGTTLYTTLLTAFGVLMARYSGQAEVVIGAPVSGRALPELAPLIGMFVNTVVLRLRMADDPTFVELVERVRATTTAAYAHQDLPLEQLVELLAPERSPTHHPVFQVMFIHDDAPALGELAGLAFAPVEFPVFDAKFDLMLSVAERRDGIHARWEYRRDRFDASTIQRASAHLVELLRAMALAPRQRALRAELLTATERRALVHAWNATAAAWPDERTLPQLFEDQVARTPDAVAVRFAARSLSYAQLAERAHRIADHLRGLGIGRGDRVGVALPRSPDLLASLLGVMLAGAAYVPFDPGYPKARLAFMLEDAAPAALISDLALDAPAATQIVRLAALAPRRGHKRRDAVAMASDPAYLMYTSGSSGQPKAAIIRHAALANYVRWAAEAYDVGCGAGAVVSTSVAFDATITSLFTPLLAGRAVVMLPETGEIEVLAALIGSGEPLGPLKLTPAHIDALRAVAPEPQPGAVHAIVVGGEPLLGEHVAWCRAAAPAARVFNEYGPTETTVGCSIYEVPAGPPPRVIPIGRPIANTRLYVLDAHQAPVPVGVTGELYIGGDGVADGYHARPALTAERFVEDPFAPVPGERLYRTGDLAAYLPDGNLRFLGRRDGQIKLRGFRIELSEIESVLAAHPAVGHAAVVVQAMASGHPRLAAFAVATAEPPTGEALRQYLETMLPAHMVPAVISVVAELPLTPNGKIDRARLAATAPAEAAAVVATTEDHRALIALWREILGVATVGVTDNFFALGGDSILGIQLVARARAHGIHFTPRQLVENQTIEALARVIERDAQVHAEQSAVTGRVPLTPIQRWFFAQDLPEPHHYNQSLLLEVPADCDAAALGRALAAVVAHHDALRARFDAAGAQTLGPPGDVVLERVDLSGVPAGQRLAELTARAAALQTQLRLDGCMLAPTLFWLGPDAPARLLLTVHHLVVDGVSWRIVLEDMLRAYGQACAGEATELPAKTSSLRAWTERLDTWAATAQRAYWDAIDAAPSKALPADLSATSDSEADAATATWTLSAADTAPLGRVAAAFNAGIEDVLLAALARTLTAAGDDASLTVDLESHGRAALFDDIDLSRTVGWFTSVFPVQLPLRDGHEPATTLIAIKEALRGVPDLGVGYGVLQRNPPARQLRFNYFGQLDRAQPAMAGFALATESCGPMKSPRAPRRYLLELNASILGGALSMDWTYSTRRFHPETIDALAARFMAELGMLARSSEGDRRYTPSDFSDVALSQADLDGVLAEVAAAHGGTP